MSSFIHNPGSFLWQVHFPLHLKKTQTKQKRQRRLAAHSFINTLLLHYSKTRTHLQTVNNFSRCYVIRVFIEFAIKFYRVRQTSVFYKKSSSNSRIICYTQIHKSFFNSACFKTSQTLLNSQQRSMTCPPEMAFQTTNLSHGTGCHGNVPHGPPVPRNHTWWKPERHLRPLTGEGKVGFLFSL